MGTEALREAEPWTHAVGRYVPRRLFELAAARGLRLRVDCAMVEVYRENRVEQVGEGPRWRCWPEGERARAGANAAAATLPCAFTALYPCSSRVKWSSFPNCPSPCHGGSCLTCCPRGGGAWSS